jgi:hypothetical protein
MLASVFGMSIVVAVFIVFFFSYKNDRSVKKNDWEGLAKSLVPLLLLFFITSGVYLISKASIDSNTVCEPVISNQTVSGSTTTYEYESYCIEQNNQSAGTLFKGMNILLYIIYSMIFIGFVFKVLLFLGVIMPNETQE